MKQAWIIAGLAVTLTGVLLWQTIADPAKRTTGLPARAASGAGAPAPRELSVDDPEPGRAALAKAANTALARPLFSQVRRPDVEAPRETPTATQEGTPRLAGVIIGPKERFALFSDATNKIRILAEGDTLGNLRIRNIRPGAVVLIGPEGERELYTTYAKAPKPEGAAR